MTRRTQAAAWHEQDPNQYEAFTYQTDPISASREV